MSSRERKDGQEPLASVTSGGSVLEMKEVWCGEEGRGREGRVEGGGALLTLLEGEAEEVESRK